MEQLPNSEKPSVAKRELVRSANILEMMNRAMRKYDEILARDINDDTRTTAMELRAEAKKLADEQIAFLTRVVCSDVQMTDSQLPELPQADTE